MFPPMLEIHGKRECPFAWRARLAAYDKGVPYSFIAFDAERPDPRSAEHNPEQRSPLLWDDGYVLPESLVIAQYIDESREGRPLMPSEARERGRMRLLLATLVSKLEVSPSHAKDKDAAVKKTREGHRSLDEALRDGRRFLGGDVPLLPDLMLWPFLALQQEDGFRIPADLPRAHAYWARARDRESLRATRANPSASRER